MRRQARRDDGEAAIVDVLRAGGCSVSHLSATDLPDLLIGRHGITHLGEVKAQEGTPRQKRLRPGQARWGAQWRGSPVHLLRSVEDALLFLARL